MLRRWFDVDQLALQGHVGNAAGQRVDDERKRFVIEVASVGERPSGKRHSPQSAGMLIITKEMLPLLGAGSRVSIACVWWMHLKHRVDVTQCHRLECERKR